MTTRFVQQSLLVAILVEVLWITQVCYAQEKSATVALPKQPVDRWKDIDERLVFLMTRLASVEASLDAIDAAIPNDNSTKSSGAGDTTTTEKANNRSDALPANPIRWREFYTQLAENFYHHPADRNPSYHTLAILHPSPNIQVDKPGSGTSQQKPPQVDHFEQIYLDAKPRNEAAVQGKPLAELLERRQSLEDEQSKLWCQITLRVIAGHELARKPLYRFQPYIASAGPMNVQRSQATKAAALFMQAALAASAQTERDPSEGFNQMVQAIAGAREKLDVALLKYLPADELRDVEQPVGKIEVLTKRLDDVASNLEDIRKSAFDNDRFKDHLQKQSFRASLQVSLLRFAEVTFALDETMETMAADWKIKSDTYIPLVLTPASNNSASSATSDHQQANSGSQPKTGHDWEVFEGSDLQNAFELGVRATNSDSGIELASGAFGQERSMATSRASYKLPLEVEFIAVANPDGCYDVQPGIGDFSLRWGEDFNKHNYLYVNDSARFEAPHIRIVPGQENVIRMSVDVDGRAVISINGQQAFDRKTHVETPGDIKIVLGGGIGHIEYRKVQVRSPATVAKIAANVVKAPDHKLPDAQAALKDEKDWKSLEGRDLQSAFELGVRAMNSDAGIDLTPAQFPADRSVATSKTSYKLPFEVEFSVVAKADGCLDVCPGFGDIELRWGDGWNSKTYLYVTKDVRFEAPHVKIVPGQENVVRMAVDRDGRITVSINGQQAFDRLTDLDPAGEAKISLGGGIGHIEYRKVRIRLETGN